MLTRLQRQLLNQIATTDRPTKAQLSMRLGWSYNATIGRLHKLWKLGLTNHPAARADGAVLTAHGLFVWLCSVKRRCELQDFTRIQPS